MTCGNDWLKLIEYKYKSNNIDERLKEKERLGWLRRKILSEHEFMMIREKVVEADFAVDRGPDHGPPVGSLEVALHDLVQFAVTEHHGLQTETFCPQQINGFLIFIRKSKNKTYRKSCSVVSQ